MTHELGIDVETDDQSMLIIELAGLPEIHTVWDGGVYKQDVTYSQVHVETTMLPDELDEWLWNNSMANYVGIFER